MSGFLNYSYTGIDEIDEILSAIEKASASYHSTQYWDNCDDDISPNEQIQCAANKAAAVIESLKNYEK